MNKGRLEAFSDGVLAIILTIMVLEIKVPGDATLENLLGHYHVFLSYILSFIYIGIYWNNHHHMLHSMTRVNGAILWANLHLLFWLSLVPFSTAWMGEKHFDDFTLIFYGFTLLMSGVAYYILEKTIIADQGPNSLLKKAVGNDLKGTASVIIYLTAILMVYIGIPLVAGLLYVSVAIMWLIPDKRIERMLREREKGERN
ncbi:MULTISPECIES: TMEM175 family protein [unclassified Flavobacterium]|uniref:TMEM175 family protein n=1 Tax=unclassified Flavobacterium TaxID=196869 RepID=UPI001F12E1E4|nr:MULTISPECIES: TMEM175 family protein [unclassified Flavobacterium]UMY65377.1 TMEM175 family protein [Flavobacterium sp. HJ-32-4]HLN94925.1 TMEM175 family protein [Flavobacterium sp.]